MVLVSAIMGSYNHEKYIGYAIESVLNQTFPDLELIIIDDCSTDNSRKIIEEYQTKDQRIKAFFHTKNMGIASTLNDGLKASSGRFIGFIGSDDVWFLNKLEKQLEIIKNDEDKILWSEGVIIDGSGAVTGKKVTHLINSPRKKSGNIFQELLREDIVFGQGILFKSEFARNVKFDENLRYVNDHLFFVQLAREHDFLFMPEPLAKYRIHGANTTLKNGNTWFKERILIRNLFLQTYSAEMSTSTKADIYYKIGHAFTGLGRKDLAKQYYFKAIQIDHFHTSLFLYLIFALTGGQGSMGKFLSSYYHAVSSFLF